MAGLPFEKEGLTGVKALSEGARSQSLPFLFGQVREQADLREKVRGLRHVLNGHA